MIPHHVQSGNGNAMRKADAVKGPPTGLADAGLSRLLALPEPAHPPRAPAAPRRRASPAPGLPSLLPDGVAEADEPPGHLGHRARMRQRLLAAGPEAVLDHELLEMVLFLALPRRDTKPIARALLSRFGSFANAIAAPPIELRGVAGLGEAGTAALKTVQAAAFRLAREELKQTFVLNSWDRLIDYLTVHLARERVEEVHVLFLDTRNRLIADEVQGRGTVNHTPVYPREVVKRALELQANAMILVHNHPSGDPTPSRADIEMTGEIKAAATVFGIVLHDHIIIGNGRHVSLRQEGLL
jgi:DNA repair protein RadC